MENFEITFGMRIEMYKGHLFQKLKDQSCLKLASSTVIKIDFFTHPKDTFKGTDFYRKTQNHITDIY